MAEHSGKTGEVKKIKLESSIQQVYWTRRAACAGGNIGLEVFTHYVGNNAELKIELTDKSGKGHGNFSDKIHGNHFWAPIMVPADAKEELYATVKLSKHGLSHKSGPLIILPPVQISNVKWAKKELHRGDVVRLAADITNAPDGVEASIEIWENDSDGAHEFITRFPATVKNKKIEADWEFIYGGDVRVIPIAKETEKGYEQPTLFFKVIVGAVSAESERIPFKDSLDFELVDADGKPVPNAEYILHLPDGSEQQGKVDGEGKAHEKDLPPGRVQVEIRGLKNVSAKRV